MDVGCMGWILILTLPHKHECIQNVNCQPVNVHSTEHFLFLNRTQLVTLQRNALQNITT